MSTFFLISDYGDLHSTARLLKHEKHDVKLHVRHPEARDVGKGLVDLVGFPTPPPGSIVLFDSAGHGTQGATFRQKGHPVIGGNAIDKDLELDRAKGTQAFRDAGIAVPETHPFTSLAHGRTFLATHRGEWFWKPNGNLSCATTYSGKDPAQLSRFLAWADGHVQGLKGFELQKKVPGVEVSVEGWFDGTRFVEPFNSTLEDKKLMDGDLGPRTGCQANVVWPWATTKLAEATVARLEPVLKKARYVGPIDANVIVDADGTPHGLEWSPRTGFLALQAYLMLLKPGTVGDQLEAFARGSLQRWDLRDELALALCVSTPPFPAERDQLGNMTRRPRPLPVHGLPLDPTLCDDPTRVCVDDVMLKDGLPALAGRDGNVGCVVVTGTEIGPLRRAVVKAAQQLDIPNRQHRMDVVPRVEAVIAVLKTHGYIQAADVIDASRPKADPQALDRPRKPRSAA